MDDGEDLHSCFLDSRKVVLLYVHEKGVVVKTEEDIVPSEKDRGLMALVEVSGPFAFFRIYKLRIKNKIPWSFSCRKNRDCVFRPSGELHQGEKHTAGTLWIRIAVFSASLEHRKRLPQGWGRECIVRLWL